MDHSILEGVPERGIGEHLGLVGVNLGGIIRGDRRERCRHRPAESVHEVRKVLLAGGTQASGPAELLAIGLVVTWAGHVGLAAGDGG